jgi:hypothetical protein
MSPADVPGGPAVELAGDQRKQRKRRLVAAAIGCSSLLVVLGGGLLLIYLWLAHDAFPEKRANLEKIVAAVQAAGLKPGETRYFRVSPDLKPSSFQPDAGAPAMTILAGQVVANALSDGRLAVVIITDDRGHAGLHGYVYASAPLTAAEIGPDTWGGKETSIKLPGTHEWWVDRKIDDRWYEVSHNLQ